MRIYPVTRTNGYQQNSLRWYEGGQLRSKCLADFAEAEYFAQQVSIRLASNEASGGEVRHRDIEILRHCEKLLKPFGVPLVVAVEEWTAARKASPNAPLAEAARFYETKGPGKFPRRTTAQVVREFLASIKTKELSRSYLYCARSHLTGFTNKVKGQISSVTAAEINRFLSGLTELSPSSKNGIRRTIITMFGFARRQGYLEPHQKTVAEFSDRFRTAETEIAIFTPEEMKSMLSVVNVRMLPMLTIGAFAGIRSAEIQRLTWDDVKWRRGYIEITGRKAKTASRRLVPLRENLRQWLAPWTEAKGPVVPLKTPSQSLSIIGAKAGIEGGWKKNGLRHSHISYRVAETQDVPRTALESGNSARVIFKHYRAVVDEDEAKEWFSITPPENWPPDPWKQQIQRWG